MKFRTRRISACTLLLFVGCAWFWSALKIRYRKVIGTLPDTVIIFGDESASTSSFPNLARRDLPDIRTWSSSLCSSLQANCHSYAPSSPSLNSTVILDNLLLEQTEAPDLRAQVDAWITRETQRRKSGIQADLSSLFAVSFGVNDLWSFSQQLDARRAEEAVTASLDSLFEQLRRVADVWPDEVQVLVPLAMDVSLLPAWRKQRWMLDTTGQELKNVLRLQRRWNEGLKFRAEKWRHGKVMLWDADRWLGDLVRNKRSEFKDVRGTCVEKAEDGVCESPDEFLMWDDFHFSPKVQKLMAKALVEYLVAP